jgi:hypothetical protein
MSLIKVGSSVIKGDAFINKYETVTSSGTAVINADFDLDANSIIVFIDGVRQQSSAYSVTGAREITLSETVTTGTYIAVVAMDPDAIFNLNSKAEKVTGMVSGDSQVYNGSLWVPSQPNRKNFIMNGCARLWQRGTSVVYTTGQSGYLADRFTATNNTDGTLGYFQSQAIPTSSQAGYKFIDSIGLQANAADATIAAGQYAGLVYAVEGYDFRALYGNTATLSFWVRASVTGIYCVSFRTGNPVDRSYIAEYTVNAADTWEKKSITLTFNGAGTPLFTNGMGLQIWWSIAAGSTYHTTVNAWQSGNYLTTSNQVNAMGTLNNAWRIVGIQLEPGSVVTPFMHRPFPEELALCQRYYEKSYDVITAPGTVSADGFIRHLAADTVKFYDWGNTWYKVEKRTSVSPTFYSFYNTNIAGVWSREGTGDVAMTPYPANAKGFGAYSSGGGLTAGNNYLAHWACSAEL